MYESPINIETMTRRLVEEVSKDTGERIYRAVLSYDIDVDKEELFRALRYDRDQYNRGFNDGIMAAADELVRCKDCIHGTAFGEIINCRIYPEWYWFKEDHFCADGERRTSDD